MRRESLKAVTSLMNVSKEMVTAFTMPCALPISFYTAIDGSPFYLGEIVLVKPSEDGRDVLDFDIVTDEIGRATLNRFSFQMASFALQTSKGKTFCVSEASVITKYQHSLPIKPKTSEVGITFHMYGKPSELQHE